MYDIISNNVHKLYKYFFKQSCRYAGLPHYAYEYILLTKLRA